MSEQEKREDGWYWVLLKPGDDWEVAEKIGGYWYFSGHDGRIQERRPREIGPRVQRDSEVVRQRDELLAALKSEVVFIEGLRDIDYHSQGMGCGLEDRGVTDRYEAMKYGWEEALDRAYDQAPDIEEMANLIARIEAEKSGVTP